VWHRVESPDVKTLISPWGFESLYLIKIIDMEIVESVVKRANSYLRDTEDCIEYPILNKDGYGEMQTYLLGKKKHYLMHRVSFQIFSGIDISSDNIICHKCDNPSCINPRHLVLGTHLENVKDRVIKNRSAKGKNNGRYKHGTYVKNNPNG
jgi:hypothetical protein